MVIEMFVSRVAEDTDNKLVIVMRDVTSIRTARAALQNAEADLRILSDA